MKCHKNCPACAEGLEPGTLAHTFRMEDEPPVKRGRPPGSRNKHGTPKINVHYRVDPRVDAALRNPGPVSATLEDWAKRAGDDVLMSAGCDGPGVYTITNVLTGRRYIGSSSNMLHRWRQHRGDLNNECHANKHMQEAWKEDRLQFRFGVLFIAPAEMSRSELYEVEMAFIDEETAPYNCDLSAPRPGFGGKQPGAGRKPSPVGDKPIQVNVLLEPDLCRKLDTLRGAVPRAEWFRRMLAEARPPRPPVVVSHHEVLCSACYLADEPFATYRCTSSACPNAAEPEGQSWRRDAVLPAYPRSPPRPV